MQEEREYLVRRGIRNSGWDLAPGLGVGCLLMLYSRAPCLACDETDERND
jgi:tRNA splicing endonuclease